MATANVDAVLKSFRKFAIALSTMSCGIALISSVIAAFRFS